MEYTAQNIQSWYELGPRKTVGQAMYQIGQKDKELVVCCADAANRVGIENFRSEFSERFLETGISEQSMIGAAAGFSNEGFHACAIAYAPFASSRILDQVRVYLGYMKSPVTIIGLAAGLSLGDLGATHTAVEDAAGMRAIPNLVVISPADCTETVKSIEVAVSLNQPVYIRLTGGSTLPMIYHEDYPFTIGKAVGLREGTDVAIIATGSCVYRSLKAAQRLERDGISCGVINMHTIKPLDNETVLGQFAKKLIVTVEEHNIIGGLGGAVAEVLSEYRAHPPLLRLGVNDAYYYADTYERLMEKAGLTADGISDSILKAFKNA